MNRKEVSYLVQELFQKELKDGKKRHIVFWYDEDGEFVDDIDELNLKDVRVWKLTPNNLFATKYEIEKRDTHSHFLVYSNMEKPSPREDWLLDIYQYSFEFATDKITIIMRDLNITNDSLRPLFKKYTKFFNNKERYNMFRSYPITEFTEEAVDISVLSVLCKSPVRSMEEVVKALFKELDQSNPKVWESIQKYGDEETFWTLMDKHYGYHLEGRSILDLFTFFTTTYLSATITAPIPQKWEKFISNRPSNSIVFMNQWMNNKDDRFTYNKLSTRVEELLQVKYVMKDWEIKDYMKADAFRLFDESVIRYISSQLMNDIHLYESYMAMISERRTLHWYSEFQYEYESLMQSILLFKKAYELEYFITQQSPYEMFQAYSAEYYNLDTAYRKFYVAYDKIVNKETLLPLKEKVENLYTNWYCDELSIKWSNAIENEQKDQWPITGVDQQIDFYKTSIQPYIKKGERIFVIISDALRFEAAKELSEMLNKERKGSTEITTLQGVAPSYTDLGMASLLPHKQISYQDGNVFVDGFRAKGSENRSVILQHHVPESIAIQYNHLMDMNRPRLREMISGKKLIYIYHNSIDARGDHAATEREVFEAVEDTFQDISILINHLVNSVSASNIIITADHGFLYQRDPLLANDKVVKKTNNTIIEKRRFILTESKLEMEGTMTFPMDYLTDNDSLYVTVPRGSNRFSVQGAGANFVHGGTILQEIMIPVIKFKNDRSKSVKNDTSRVNVKLTSISRRITNMITYLDFFQTERVEEKKQPWRLKVYFIDGEGKRISNENIIIADHTSSNPEERTFKEKFVFKNIEYDKGSKFYLVLIDEEDSGEMIYDKIPFSIDIAPTNGTGY